MAFLLRKPRVLRSLVTKSFRKTLHTLAIDEVASDPSDPIEQFVDELLSKRQLRWDVQQQTKIIQENIASDTKYFSKLDNVKSLIDSIKSETDSDVMFLTADFEKLDRKHIDHLVLTACHHTNTEFIEEFVDQCIAKNKVISENSVLTLFEYFSAFSDNRTLIKLIELCKLNNRSLYDRNCEFNHFIARNLWKKGNSDGALNLLDKTYRKANKSARESIQLILKLIIEDTVGKRSEAVLLRLIKSAALLQEEYNEPTVLTYVWKVCFLSNWSSDHVISDKLFRHYPSIRIDAAKRFM